MNIEIRRAKVEDAIEITNIYHDAYQENERLGFPASASTVKVKEVEKWISESNIFIALTNHEIVGAVRLAINDKMNKLVIGRLGVSSNWKGKGIASILMNYAENEALKLGWKTVTLTTPINHPYLPEMYRRRGYKDVGVRELEGPYDEVVLEKILC
jgi:predicted N-acetyltransferase YhbS